MKQTTHIVYYRDVKGAPLKIYGPFVSETLAFNFADQLPNPLPTGTKNVHTVSGFTSHEASLARAEIHKERRRSMAA